MNARSILLLLTGLLLLGVGLFLYRGGGNPLHLDPHAAEEIEKAKRR